MKLLTPLYNRGLNKPTVVYLKESCSPLFHSRAQRKQKVVSKKAKKWSGEARARVRPKFLAYPLIPKSRSCSHSVAIMFHCAYRYSGHHAFSWSVDCNGKIQAVSITVSVPIISELDPDTFTLARGEVSIFRDGFQIFLEIFSLTSLSYFCFHT